MARVERLLQRQRGHAEMRVKWGVAPEWARYPGSLSAVPTELWISLDRTWGDGLQGGPTGAAAAAVCCC